MSYRSTIARQPQQLASSLSVIETELKQLDLALLRKGALAVTGIGASYEAAVVTAGNCSDADAAPWRGTPSISCNQ